MSNAQYSRKAKPWGLIVGKYLFANPHTSCICDWMIKETGKPYKCEPETFARCVERRKRGASAAAPSAKPPLSNRGVSSSPEGPIDTNS